MTCSKSDKEKTEGHMVLGGFSDKIHELDMVCVVRKMGSLEARTDGV